MSKENADVAILNTPTNRGGDRTEVYVVSDRNAHPLDRRECLALLAGGSFTPDIPRRKYEEFHERFEK